MIKCLPRRPEDLKVDFWHPHLKTKQNNKNSHGIGIVQVLTAVLVGPQTHRSQNLDGQPAQIICELWAQ